MYSRCPHCDRQQTVSTAQLRDGRGLLRCCHCGERFDALATLTDDHDEPIVSSQAIEVFDSQPASTDYARRPWFVANLCLLSILLIQIGYFERERWLAVAPVRLLIHSTTKAFGLRGVGYHDAEQWSLSHGELKRAGAGYFVFTAAISNQSDVDQNYPALKLTLTDFNGVAVAERLFDADIIGQDELAAGQTRALRLDLMVARDDIGGFLYSLI